METPANLSPPAASVLLFELHAAGVQIYTCQPDRNDATKYVWTFKAPEADLLNSRGELVGTHFAGPTWQGLDGSAVISAVLERADAPDATAIPWLLLEAKEHQGSGWTPLGELPRQKVVMSPTMERKPASRPRQPTPSTIQ